MTEPRATVRLTDPKAMRVLAHPTRLQLLGALRLHGPQTVGALSDRLDEAVGSVSYHLGKLAGHGLVEPAPELARNARERWWRAAHASTTWEPAEFLDDPERRAAMHLFQRTILDRYVEVIGEYLNAEATMAPEWVRGGSSGDTHMYLTSQELAELRTELEALAERWQARGDADRPDAHLCSLMYFAFRRPA